MERNNRNEEVEVEVIRNFELDLTSTPRAKIN